MSMHEQANGYEVIEDLHEPWLKVGTRLESGPSWQLSGRGFDKPMTTADRQRVTDVLGRIAALPEDDPKAVDG